ncbi:MAG: hypothetical protein ACLRS8_14555 [Parabacteroides merdae]
MTTQKEDTPIDPVRLMYDKNLESVNTLTAGSRITIDKAERRPARTVLRSGSLAAQVVVEGAPLKGKSETSALYSAPANYIKLSKRAARRV